MLIQQIWAAYDAGDRVAAMEGLYSLLDCVPVGRGEEARECVHEAFLIVWRRLAEVEKRQSLRAFCFGVVRNVARSRRMRQPIFDVDPGVICCRRPDPEKACARREMLALAIAEVRRDPDGELILRALAGEERDMSMALGYGAYRNRKCRALARIRRRTTKHLYEREMHRGRA